LTDEIDNHIHLIAMAASAKCPPRRLLVQGSFTTVEHCRCGAVYLNVGPVCLRLESSALRELAEVILEASLILSGDREEVSGGDPTVEQTVEQSPPSKLN
jgi:hypothetical protein